MKPSCYQNDTVAPTNQPTNLGIVQKEANVQAKTRELYYNLNSNKAHKTAKYKGIMASPWNHSCLCQLAILRYLSLLIALKS